MKFDLILNAKIKKILLNHYQKKLLLSIALTTKILDNTAQFVIVLHCVRLSTIIKPITYITHTIYIINTNII